MPNLPHILVVRTEFEQPRRRYGSGRPPSRSYAEHGPILQAQLEEVVRAFDASHPPAGLDPNLILRIRLHPNSAVDEENWERCQLTLLSIDQYKTLVLFSSDRQLAEFRQRLREYQAGPQVAEQRNAPYAAIFACIDEINSVREEDRIGRLLRQAGINDSNGIEPARTYVVDVELWDFGGRDANLRRVDQIEGFVRARGAEATDRYIGESLVLVRVRGNGEVIRELLRIDAVAQVDLPPQPSLRIAEMLTRALPDFAAVPNPAADAPAIAILDSGLTAGHPMLAPAIGEVTAIPQTLGDGADDNGHGTLVGGLALYGDVETCIARGVFIPHLRLYSARVLNAAGKFDNEALITTQMREAIEYFTTAYGCRVFNLSLGDDNLPYRGGKVSPWASILDTLARELNILIVVSAGNFSYGLQGEEFPDAHLQRYPRYLLEDDARIIEPATGSIVMTVGALAHSANVPPGRHVEVRPISQEGEPSPFTRSGPGLGGAVKPELCEFGGNQVYDGALRRVLALNELSVVSTHRDYLRRLFAADVGTSFAAPRVAHIAARLLQTFPNASANLIRALLVSSASVPEQALNRLSPLANDAVLRVCGFGRPNLESAMFSQEDRVVLLGESELGHDRFHVYEIPIPEEFLVGRELRTIEVTLAYDPPVRHSRFDYLGVKMSFRLIRGRTLEQVIAAFRTQAGSLNPVESLASTSFNCGMRPGPEAREGGTVQRAAFEIRRPPRPDYGDTYYLVVRCEKKWARPEHAPQRYAVVVVLRQEGAANIYEQVTQRIRAAVRARVR